MFEVKKSESMIHKADTEALGGCMMCGTVTDMSAKVLHWFCQGMLQSYNRSNGTVHMENCKFLGNVAIMDGGGIFYNVSTAQFCKAYRNCSAFRTVQ